MLFDFGDGLWVADGTVVTAALGFHYPTRMAVIRLSDGGLAIWSPVALTPPIRRGIDALGPVKFLIAPNSLHHLFLPEWAGAYPQAQLCAAPGGGRKQPALNVDAIPGEDAPDAWSDVLDHVAIRGNRITTETVFFHRPSRTVLIADLVQQLPPDWFGGWRARVARMDLMTGPEPTVPRKFRLAFTDKGAAKVAVEQMLNWPCEQVALAHGPLIWSGGQAVLRRAFVWLTG